MADNTEYEISPKSLKRIIPRQDKLLNCGSGYV